MKKLSMKKLSIIKASSEESFLEGVNTFFLEHPSIFSFKAQRNLYYAGIGGSAGRTPGVTAPCPPAEKLVESYVGFIVFEDTP